MERQAEIAGDADADRRPFKVSAAKANEHRRDH
jgi:hypothetical protein